MLLVRQIGTDAMKFEDLESRVQRFDAFTENPNINALKEADILVRELWNEVVFLRDSTNTIDNMVGDIEKVIEHYT